MFKQLSHSDGQKLVALAATDKAHKYIPATDMEKFHSGQFAVICADTLRFEFMECCTPEAIHRAIELSSGDPERQVWMVPRSEIGHP